AQSLPCFWFYSFHYMEQCLSCSLTCVSNFHDPVSEFPTYSCTVLGADVLSYLDSENIGHGKWAVILVGI
ncbi:hypothetical protein C8R45DRAFT_794085, partial [Mycena sanguinolenta]